MDQDFNPTPGAPVLLEPGLVRIVAPNPHPMTFRGTNSYLLGTDSLAVIDPGPADETHLDALLRAIGKRPVSHIIVTHSHRDHSALAAPLARATGAPVLAFGASDAGRSAVMQGLAAQGLTGGSEGVDAEFRPDVLLRDQEVFAAGGHDLRVLHTPGHMGNHICLVRGDAILTGDHVMGWATSLVSPPEGCLTDYMASLSRLAALPARVFHPGHGAPVSDPATRCDWLIRHRRDREAQILAALAQGPADIPALTAAIYADVPQQMHPVAARNVFAHLIDLHLRLRVTATPLLSLTAQFALARS